MDLSHVIDPTIPLWPGDPAVCFDVVATLPDQGYFLRQLTIGEHSATHMNAPAGFFRDGAPIDSYLSAHLVLPAVVFDVTQAAQMDADYLLSPADLAAWEVQYGPVPAGALVLLRTGWDRYWHQAFAFLGQDDSGGLHFPGFGRSAVQFLLQERGIAGVGIDTHGVDGGQDTQLHINRMVLDRQGVVLENLNNLAQLPSLGATLVIGLLRLRGGSGSPVSVLAFIP